MHIILSSLPGPNSLLPKRPTAASFSVTTAEVVVADAFGDVYKLPITGSVSLRGDCDQGSALLLGHFSTVTTLALKGSMIATADRDNKLRVSRFPDSFVVQSFCLAHEEFITCVRWIGSDRLISGAGDGTIRLWNAADGQLLETVQLREHVSDKPSDSNAVKVSPVVTCVEVYPDNPDIAVIAVYRANYVLVATGLLSSRLRIHCAFRFEEGNCITGIGFDEKCHLWVSLSSDSNSVRVYSLRGLETSEPRFELKGTMQVEHDDQTQSEETSLEKGATSLSVMRFDWLNQQRKREMVEDWKGKKRKHIEI